MRQIPPPPESGLQPAPAVNHILLVDTDTDGLVLVETGFGRVDLEQPQEALGEVFLGRAQPALDPQQTAVEQLITLGYKPADVKHIVLTHLDLDHTGGLPDFPDAAVHVHDAEYRAAMATTSPHPEHHTRYRPAHWAHWPHWITYPNRADTEWFGFDAIQLQGLPPEILLIPLAGHTAGHCAVAVDDGDRWLLHAGDAYYYHAELARPPHWSIPGWDALEQATEVDRPLRLANQARLRELIGLHGDQVEVFSAHDPWELQRYLERVG